jgi:hypothetical protein
MASHIRGGIRPPKPDRTLIRDYKIINDVLYLLPHPSPENWLKSYLYDR